jgi:dihydroneopterin aldolase
MKSQATSVVELRDLKLNTNIGTYGPNDTKPDEHRLDLTLGIGAHQVLISQDEMSQVFDYDPLIAEIERLAAYVHYETQERLITRIAQACAAYQDIKHIEICLRKSPVRSGGGSLGIRLKVDENAIEALRPNSAARA